MLNSALATAGITTLTFVNVTATVISAKTYPNLIDYSGYILDSDSLKVNSIITGELAKFGPWTVIKSTARVVATPVDPSGDHYITLTGYYVNNTDLPQAEVQYAQFKLDVENIAKAVSNNIQGKARPIGYSIVSESSVVNIVDDASPAPVGTKTVTTTVTVKIFKAP